MCLKSLQNRTVENSPHFLIKKLKIHGELDRLASSCAEGVVCGTYSVGTSYEGRDLKVLSVSYT